MQIKTEYSKAIERKYPESIALAIAKDEQGKHNPIALGWVMCTSHNPPMLAISVGLTRYSYQALRGAKEFVVSFPSSKQAEEVMFFGTKSGKEMDKIAACNTPTQPATEIDSVLLTDAIANFECVLESETVTGDHAIFVGRVVAAHVNDDEALQRVYSLPDGQGLGAVQAVQA